ncbi:hypothetical protein D3C75_1028870 [compost metagenome]
MNTRPAITGEMAKGRSISVRRKFLPLNRNLVMAQAAATPNTVLRGTVIRAVSRVSRTAANASLSRRAAK